jgi:prepilin-type N-terminal cleavage/methylation domain-containing protein
MVLCCGFDRRGIKSFRNGQNGFTALELLCAIAMLGLVTAVLSISVVQIKTATPKVNARTMAAQDTVSAGNLFYHDVMMAQTSDLPDNGQTAPSVTLTWLDTFEDQYTFHTAHYHLVDGQLRREYDGIPRVIARHVTAVAFWFDGTTVYMSLTSQVNDQRPELAMTQTYQARMRAVE